MIYKSIFFLFFIYLSYFSLSKTSIPLSIQEQKSFGISVAETSVTLNREYIFAVFSKPFHLNHKNNDFGVEFIRNLQANDQEKHSV